MMRKQSPQYNRSSNLTIRKVESVDAANSPEGGTPQQRRLQALSPVAASERERKLAVSGAPKIIRVRAGGGGDTFEKMNDISNRLRQHQNESVQASFESYVDSENPDGQQSEQVNGAENADLQNLDFRRMIESRSSVLLDAAKEDLEHIKMNCGNVPPLGDTDGGLQLQQRQDLRGDVVSPQSFELNNDLNFQIRGTAAAGGVVVEGSSKNVGRNKVRKIMTNSLKANKPWQSGIGLLGDSRKLEKKNPYISPNYSREDLSPPVIITSLNSLNNSNLSNNMKNNTSNRQIGVKQQAQLQVVSKSIVIDMRSSTPNSPRKGNSNLSRIETKPCDEQFGANLYNRETNPITPNIKQKNMLTVQSVLQNETDREQQSDLVEVIPPMVTQNERTKVPLLTFEQVEGSVAAETTDGSVSSKFPLKDSGRLESTIYKNANTVRLTLFENNNLDGKAGGVGKRAQGGSPSRITLEKQSVAAMAATMVQSNNQSPFRPNTTTYSNLIVTLDQIAAQLTQHNENSGGLSVTELKLGQPQVSAKASKQSPSSKGKIGDEAMRRLFKDAVTFTTKNQAELSSGKKWKTMTPYEKSKVVETFLRLQRDAEKSRKVEPHPKRFQQDLSLCLSVGEIKPGPNPFIKAAEKKLGTLKSEDSSELVWDESTLRDPLKIITSVLSAQQRKAQETAQYCPENLPENQYFTILPSQLASYDILPPKLTGPDGDLPNTPNTEINCRSATESQILNELELFRQQKEVLMQGNQTTPDRLNNSKIEQKELQKSTTLLGLSPSQNVLQNYQRYQLGERSKSIVGIEDNAGKVKSMESSSQDALLQPLIEKIIQQKQPEQQHLNVRRRVEMKDSLTNVSVCRRLSPRMVHGKSPFNQQSSNNINGEQRPLLQKVSTQNIKYAHFGSREQIMVRDTNDSSPVEEELLAPEPTMSIIQRPHKVTLKKHQYSNYQTVQASEQSEQILKQPDANIDNPNSTGKAENIESLQPQVSLREQIRDTLFQQEATQRFSRGQPAVLNIIRSQEDLQAMTQLNLQAISLTKKHQQTIAQPPFVGNKNRIFHLPTTNSPIAERKILGYQLGQSESGTLADLKPIVQQQSLLLNTPSYAAVDQPLMIMRGQKMVSEQLQPLVSESMAPPTNQKASQLEVRMRRNQNQTTTTVMGNEQIFAQVMEPVEPGQSDTNSDGQGNSPSPLTHLIEPTLLNNTPTLQVEECKRSRAQLSQRSRKQMMAATVKQGDGTNNAGFCTFQNEEDSDRVKASSQMVTTGNISSPDEGQKEMKILDKLTWAGGDCTPALLSAETPLQLASNGTSGEYRIILQNELGNSKPMTQPAIEETPPRYEKSQVQLKPSTHNVSMLHETASFAGLMHKSTGLPINGIGTGSFGYNTKLRPSFATANSVVGILNNHANSTVRVREGSLDHSVATINSGLLSLASPFTSPRLTQDANSQLQSPYSHRIYIQTNQGDQPPMSSRTHSTWQAANNEIFQDKRVPKGKKLFVATESERNAGSIGGRKATQASLATVSPLAHGGQKIMMAFGNRRNYEKTATPIDKLLKPNELTELQRFIKGNQRKQTKIGPNSPTKGAFGGEQYFGQKRPTREFVLSQVSTARILSNSTSSEKASGLEIQSKLKAMESPQQKISTSRHLNGSSHMWQPLYMSLKPPMFGAPIKATDEAYESNSNRSTKMHQIYATHDGMALSARIGGVDQANLGYTRSSIRNNKDSFESKVATAAHTNLASQQNISQHGQTMSSRGPVRGRPLNSTRYTLGNGEDAINDVKMVGLKAVLNQNDSTLPALPMTAVPTKTHKKLISDGRGSDMCSNLQQTPQQEEGAQQPIIGIIGVDFEQSEGNQIKSNFSPRIHSQQQALLLGMGKPSQHSVKESQGTENQTSDAADSQRSSLSRSKLNKYQENQVLVSVEGQHIQIADGVLPRYREQLARRQQLAESARRRYASCASRNGVNAEASGATSRRTVHQNQLNQQSNGLTHKQPAASFVHTKSSLPIVVADNDFQTTSLRQKKSGKRDVKFLFNDVKNWKKSVQRNNELITGSVGALSSLQFATLN